EYYTLPAFPALALLIGKQCASLWERGVKWPGILLASLGAVIGIALITIAASVSSGDTSKFLGLKCSPDIYAYYLDHLFELTPESLRALRLPLIMAGLGLSIALPLHAFVKRAEAKAAALTAAMVILFTAANISILIFAPRLTSEPLAQE